MLHQGLTPLTKRPRFLLFKNVPKPEGGTTKIPCNSRGYAVRAADPDAWMTYEQACAKSAETGLGLAYYLKEGDGVFCFDVDKCREADGWTAQALAHVARMHGCAVEVSTSGNGLHIWGTYQGDEPKHRCRNGALNIELYTSKRFIAFGSLQELGSGAMLDASESLALLIDEHFTPKPGQGTGEIDWDDAPDEDKDQWIIDKALNAKKSAQQEFGGFACFRDLWENNVDVLAATWPAQGDGENPYDGSMADASLAQRLAFWCANRAGWMKRIMLKSGLIRDKWIDREVDYLEATIIQAIDKQADDPVYNPEANRTEAQQKAIAAVEQELRERPGVGRGCMLSGDKQADLFGSFVYIQDQHRALTVKGIMLKAEVFRATYGGRSFVLKADNTKVVTNAWEAFTESQVFLRREAESGAFKPERPYGEIFEQGGTTLVNTYFPIRTPSTPGDVTRFLDHLELLLPDQRDRDIVLAYMAAVVQYKGVKFQWCPLIQGCEGNGKTLLSYVLAEAIGRKYTRWPKASELDSKFNGWIAEAVLVCVEDVHIPGHRMELMENLKPMITSASGYEIQRKGQDQVSQDICANFMLNSNHKAAVAKHKGDRRFAIFYSAQQSLDDIEACGMGGSYFPELYSWLRAEGYAYLTHYLENYDIPAHLNPGTNALHRAPETSSFEEVIEECRSPQEQVILEAIHEHRPGFSGGFVSAGMLPDLFKVQGLRPLAPKVVKRVLGGIGYVPHPVLYAGQAPRVVNPDGVRAKLYCKKGESPGGLCPKEVCAEYEKKQRTPESS